MPFTLSHPAAVIPFLRTRLVPSALVIGSMAPDFEYFALFSPRGGFGHTLPGVFVFDLPAAIVVLWLYHAYAKEPLYTWLPESVRRRIQLGPATLPVKNLAQFALVVLSILIGIATHLLWDSFTHPKFWPYRHWQFLHRTVLVPGFGPLQYVRVIQHASTICGALLILLWFRHWFRKTAPTQPDAARYPRKNRRAALLVICIVALIAPVLLAFLEPEFGNPQHITAHRFFFERCVIMAINVFCIGVVVYGAATTGVRGRRWGV
jgi:hypothetical protein